MMANETGKHFDPEILDCFLDILPAIREIRTEISETSNDVTDISQLTGTFG